MKVLYCLIIFFIFSSSSYSQCNLFQELCDKKYSEVCFLTTHNAYNAGDDEFLLPNQNKSITTQLEDGVRALMIDIYLSEEGVPSVFHSFEFLGSESLESVFAKIKNFMDRNPNEVVTLIIECYVGVEIIRESLMSSGLFDLLYTKQSAQDWNTLQEMIDNKTTLVILSDCNDATSTDAWYHYVWDLAVETDFSNNTVQDLDCMYNRGQADNDLFILNHFITDPVYGVGQTNISAMINSNPFFIDHVLECEATKQKEVNFLTVDFYELGNSLQVVNELNNIIISETIEAYLLLPEVKLFPQPSSDQITISSNEIIQSVSIFTIDSKIISHKQVGKSTTDINVDFLASGMYITRIEFENHSIFKKLMIR